MNIKLAETLTGITSKNIRFYEDSGLLHPKRNEQNGYREYTDKDIHRIKLIRMLRKLDMSIDTIREVLDGQQRLDAVMAAQYNKLEQSIRQMEAAKLDGIEYNATRMTSIYGSFVVANALNPERLDDPDIPKPKLKRMEIVWRFVIPICFWVGMALLFLLPIFGNYLSQL